MGKRWSNLLRSIERHYGERPQYSKAVETQARGGLHLHVPLRTSVRMTQRRLKVLAMAAGFGHEVDYQVVNVGDAAQVSRIATYVSKYVSKAVDDRPDIPWAVPLEDPWTGESRMVDAPATYRTFSQSRKWGASLTQLRHQARARYLANEVGMHLAVEVRPAPGPEAGPVDAPAPDV